jgi:hypothetical protein
LGLIDEPEADLRNVIHQFQRTAGLRIGAAHCIQLEIAQHVRSFFGGVTGQDTSARRRCPRQMGRWAIAMLPDSEDTKPGARDPRRPTLPRPPNRPV